MISARISASFLVFSWLLSGCAMLDDSNAKKTAPFGLIATPISYYSTPKAKYLGTKYKENLDRLVEQIVSNPKTAPLQFANNISSVGGIGFFTHSATKTGDERYLEVVLATPETFETKGDYNEKIQRLFSLYGFDLLHILTSDNEIYQDRELSGYGLNLAWRNVVSDSAGSRVMLARAIIYLPKERVRSYLRNEIKQNDLLANAVIFGGEEDGPLALVSYQPQDPRPDFRPAIQEDNLTASSETKPTQTLSKQSMEQANQTQELANRETSTPKSGVTTKLSGPEVKNDRAVESAAVQTPAVVPELTKGDAGSGEVAARPAEPIAMPKSPTNEIQTPLPQSVESPVAEPVEKNATKTSSADSIESAKPAVSASNTEGEPANSVSNSKGQGAETVMANLSTENPSDVPTEGSDKTHESSQQAIVAKRQMNVRKPIEKALPSEKNEASKTAVLKSATAEPAESKPAVAIPAAKLEVPAPQNQAGASQSEAAANGNVSAAKSSDAVPVQTTRVETDKSLSPSHATAKSIAAGSSLKAPPVQMPALPERKPTLAPNGKSESLGSESNTLSIQPLAPSARPVVGEKTAPDPVQLEKKQTAPIVETKQPSVLAKPPRQPQGGEVTSSPALAAMPEPMRSAPEQLASLKKPTDTIVERKPMVRPAARALEGFIIQIAFNDRDKAQHWAEAMEQRGYAVSITEAGSEGALRVRLGNFAIRDEAERQLQSLKQDGMNGIIINLPQAFRPARSSVP